MGDSKDVLISGRKYAIRKMTPQVACLIYGQLVGVSIKFTRDQQLQQQFSDDKPTQADLKDQAESAVEMLWKIAPSVLEKKQCEQIQNDALRACSFYPTESVNVPAPVLMADGRFADNALEDDGPSVGELIEEALKFSVAPFFLKGLAKASTPKG